MSMATRSLSLSFTSISLLPTTTTKPSILKTQRLRTTRQHIKQQCQVISSAAKTSNSSESFRQTVGGPALPTNEENKASKNKKRVFFLDVNPLCYEGSKPSFHSFVHWISLFFSQVSLTDPVVAVFDGEKGYEFRRKLLPSYKAHRKKFQSEAWYRKPNFEGHSGTFYQVADILTQCNVPAVKIKGHEADDVVATLASQVLEKGYRVVIASPDKDFKQLISHDVQMVMPIAELGRWSYYTLKHYVAQYNCYPSSDLSLRCIIGDEVDGVPGIQHMVPGFGRKTAVKLLKKHGSLENLLSAAAVRTVGRQYVQESLTKYADFLRKNYEVLSLRRDLDIQLQDEWLVERDTHKDSIIVSNFFKMPERTQAESLTKL